MKKWNLPLIFMVLVVAFNFPEGIPLGQLSTFNLLYAQVSETVSYFTTNNFIFQADGVTPCTITIFVKTDTGVVLSGKQVTISTNRGTGKDNIAQPSLTDSNGQCTGTITSLWAGDCTITITCDGKTILGNLIPNFSFENGIAGDAYNWAESGNQYRDNTRAKTGNWSLVETTGSTGGSYSDWFSVATKSYYKFSAYMYNSLLSGTQYFDLDDPNVSDPNSADVHLQSTTGANIWEYGEGTWYSASLSTRRIRSIGENPVGSAWWDDARLQRIPTINFTATKIKIASAPFTITVNNPSPAIIIQAQGNNGDTDTTFNDSVVLSSSSGTFSLNKTTWQNTTTVYLAQGQVIVYFKDSSAGNPIITVSRTGFSSDTQVESIVNPSVNIDYSTIRADTGSISATGQNSATITVTINDTYGYSLGAGKTVTLSTTYSTTSISANPQVTDSNGQCTFTVSSGWAGYDTITATCDGKTLSNAFFDSFSTYAENSSGSPIWTVHQGTWTVENGYYKGVNSGDDGYFAYGASAGNINWQDYNVSVRFRKISYGTDWRDSIRVGFRWYDSNNGYTIDMIQGVNEIWFSKKSQGISTGDPSAPPPYQPLSTYSTSVYQDGNWHTLRIEARENRFKVWLDSTQIFDVVDENVMGVPWVRNGKIMLSAHRFTGATGTTEVHFDDVKVYPCLVDFNATRLAFTSSPFTMTKNNPSPVITVEVQGNNGGRDVNFNETITLSSSSGGGKFSISKTAWADSSVITLSQGAGIFYYKDSGVGNPTLTASRSGLNLGTQSETIADPTTLPGFSFIKVSPITVKASGDESVTAVVTINDTYGYPIANKLATLQMARGNSDAISANPQTSDTNGECTFTISSKYTGDDTITATSDGRTISKVFHSGLVCGFPFEDGQGSEAADVSGYNNVGALTNGPTWTPSGYSGRGLQFNGTDNYVNIPNSPSLNNQDITIMMWVKPNQLRIQGFADKSSWRLFMDDGVGHIEFDALSDAYNVVSAASDTTPVGFWSHIAGTYNSATQQAKVYFNGNISTTLNGVLSMGNTYTGAIQIASNQNNRLDGTIDEVKIYNRALSDTEIKYEYQMRAPAYFSASRLTITSAPQSMEVGVISGPVTVEARGDSGTNKDSTFNNTVSLSSSSGDGKFSASSTSWVDATYITMNAGTGTFYYKDVYPDSPVVTVSRAGITSDTQIVNVTAGTIFETNSYLRVNTCTLPANGVSRCTVTIFLRDITGSVVAGKQVTLATVRGSDSNVITQPSLTDINGMCTGAITSTWTGSDTIYATCDGKTIVENLILNPSLEIGSNTDAYDWTNENANKFRSSERARSGSYSIHLSNELGDVESSAISGIFPGSTYRFSVYCWSEVDTGFGAYADIYPDAGGSGDIPFSRNLYAWEYIDILWNSDTTPNRTARCFIAGAGVTGTAWFDDFRLQRVPTIEFTTVPAKIVITSSPFTITAGYASLVVTIEMQDTHGYKISSSGDTILLSSSSVGGKFSVARGDWQDTSIITFSAGSATFYYKDSASGNPTITVSRAGLDPAVQTENILASLVFNETASYISFTPYAQKASGVDSVAIFVTITDTYGYPISGKSVTLQTARGANTTTLSANPQTTDINGKCTFTISSAVFGTETITATCDGKTITRGVDKQGALGIWHLDTDVNDVSGNNNDGANTGALWVAGKYGGALQFDGVDDYVNCGNDASLDIASAITVEMWIKPILDSNFRGILNKGAWDKLAARKENNNNFMFYVKYSDETNNGEFEPFLLTSDFQHVVITWDSSVTSNNLKGYRNGVLETQQTNGAGKLIASSAADLIIGATSGEYFNGIIDEVRIYNRALTVEEILSNYNSICNVKFFAPATKLKITSSPQITGAGITSESFTVEARDASDSNDINFNETVTLTSSSSTGRFSTDKISWSATNDTSITLSAGAGKFYYSDPTAGSPIITVSRTGLTPDTQIITLTATSIWETNCYFATNRVSIPADGSSTCSITIVIKDISGNILGGKQVTIYSVRGDSDVIIQPGVTSPDGQCTGSISSTYPGGDTIYAICEGKTIGENLIPNGSFEIGSNTDAYNWSEGSQGARSSAYAHSGNWAMRVQADSNPVSIGNSAVSVISGSKYKFSAWFYVSSYVAGNWPFLDLNDVVGDPEIYSNQEGVWHCVENTWSDSGYSSANPRIACHSGTIATAWIDDVRLWKMPTIEFTPVATKFVITSSPFTITQNNPSAITAQAQDNYGNKATFFSETVEIISSSPGGKFSLSSATWVDTTIIYLSNGEKTFYYKDSAVGYPIITVYRAGLTPGIQSETIVAAVVNPLLSSLFNVPSSAKANSIETMSVVVNIKDGYGYPMTNKSVTLSSIRGNTNISGNPQTTDSNGQCTFVISSGYAGPDTMVAVCDGSSFDYMFFDDFSSYSEGSSGSPIWTFHQGTWTVNGGYYKGVNSGNDDYCAYGASAGNINWYDYTISLRLKVISYGSNWRDSARVGFRYQDQSNAYTLEFTNGPWTGGYRSFIHKISQGVSTVDGNYLDSSTFAINADSIWHDIVIQVQGNHIIVRADGSKIMDCYDNNFNNVPWVRNGKIMLSAHRFTGATGTTEVHFDDIKVYPILNFTATKLGFGQSAFKLKAGTSSSALTANAQGNIGGVDMTVNTAVILATSSNSGVFSANGSSWGNYGESRTLNLVDGETTFYYRDYKVGNPVLTISYPYTELNTSTQIETITAPFIRFTSSPFTISVTDTSSKIIVNAQGYSGETDTNFSETAVLSSTSPRGKFSISNTTWSDTTIVKFSGGSAEFYYRDKRAGNPALTVSNSELGLSDNQTETVTAPIITITKTQQNIRTGITGTLLAAVSGDTVEYTITTTNNGQESATGIIVTDTVAFDTNIYSPMVFISMDTSPNADSWTYTTGTVWQAWGNVPSPGDENIKGLKWKINSIAAGQNKQLKFRLRVK